MSPAWRSTNFFWSFVLFTFMGILLACTESSKLVEIGKSIVVVVVVVVVAVVIAAIVFVVVFCFFCFCLCFWRRRIKGGEIKKRE